MKTTSILVFLSFVIVAWIIVVTLLFYEKPTKSENFRANSSVDNFTIFGERCSGTNFLQQAMEKNFDLKLTWKYGWKHEFGKHVDFSNSDKTLFLCIYRNPIDWINSLYRSKYHVPPELYELKDFMTKPMKMMKGKDKKEEIPNTRNIYTGNVYKNIFELRTVKLNYLLSDMPKNVKHVEVLSYEDFCSNYDEIMKHLREKYNLKPKTTSFPERVEKIYRGGSVVKGNLEYEKPISESFVYPKLNKHVEKKAGYII